MLKPTSNIDNNCFRIVNGCKHRDNPVLKAKLFVLWCQKNQVSMDVYAFVMFDNLFLVFFKLVINNYCSLCARRKSLGGFWGWWRKKNTKSIIEKYSSPRHHVNGLAWLLSSSLLSFLQPFSFLLWKPFLVALESVALPVPPLSEILLRGPPLGGL